MTPPENGTKAALEHLGQQIDRLWENKASAEALRHALEDISEIKQALQSVERTITGRVQERYAEREAAARERKIDRRWMVGTILTATGLVIAAMAILLPTLSGGG